MNTRAQQLAQRRRHLIAECAAQRAALALQAQPLSHTLESVETGVRILNRVRLHPEWLAGAAIGLLAIRPRRLSALLRMGSTGMRSWRQLRQLRQLTPLLQHFIGPRD